MNEIEFLSKKYGVLSGSINKYVFDEDAFKNVQVCVESRRQSVQLIKLAQLLSVSTKTLTKYINEIDEDGLTRFFDHKYWITPSAYSKLFEQYPNLKYLVNKTYKTHVELSKSLSLNRSELYKNCSDGKIKKTFKHPFNSNYWCIHLSEVCYFNTLNIKKSEGYEIIIDNKTYLHKSKIIEMFTISSKTLGYAMKKERFKDYIYHNNVYYVELQELKSIKELLTSSLSFMDLVNDKKVCKRIHSKIKDEGFKKYFPNAFIFDVWGKSKWRIPISDFDNFVKNDLDNLRSYFELIDETDPFAIFKLVINKDVCCTPYQKTWETYNAFVISKLNSSRANVVTMRKEARIAGNTLLIINSTLTKEMLDYSDNELQFYLNSSVFNSSSHRFITGYIQYLRTHHRDECKFSKDIRLVTKINASTTDVYTQEQWQEYLKCAVDIDAHIQKAFCDYTYARAWLWLLLHFSIAWRNSDLFSLPDLSNINLTKYTLEWFEENTFRLGDAQLIVDALKFKCENILASKNRQHLHFLVCHDLIIPTAISIIAVEKHRVARGDDGLLSGISQVYISRLKESCSTIISFSNRKANKTLMTISLEEANKYTNLSSYAYRLSGHLRSHKPDSASLHSNTTATYLRAVNADGEIYSISRSILRRGSFGHVYRALVALTTSTVQLTMEDMTSEIDALRKEHSLIALESLASQVLHTQQETLDVLKELMEKPKSELNEIFKDLSEGKRQSKTLYTQCLKQKDKCPFLYQSCCFGCKYNIPSVYALNGLKDYINYHITTLKENNSQNYIIKAKSTVQLFKSLDVLKQFKIHFDPLDQNYLSAIIDIEKLSDEFATLEENDQLLV